MLTIKPDGKDFIAAVDGRRVYQTKEQVESIVRRMKTVLTKTESTSRHWEDVPDSNIKISLIYDAWYSTHFADNPPAVFYLNMEKRGGVCVMWASGQLVTQEKYFKFTAAEFGALIKTIEDAIATC